MVDHEIEEIEDEFLLGTFKIGEFNFGLNTLFIQEVSMVVDTTNVHNAPEYVFGIINLRGNISTVIDLGKKMEIDSVTLSEGSRILIVPWKDEQVGLLVDEVTDVISVRKDKVVEPPANIDGARRKFYAGAVQDAGIIYGVLDLDAVLEVV